MMKRITKYLLLFVLLGIFEGHSFAQISISIDTLEISPLLFQRYEIEDDSIVYTSVSEYEKPQIRVVVSVIGCGEGEKLAIYKFWGRFNFHGHIVKNGLICGGYGNEKKSEIELQNPNFFDRIFYKNPENGIEDYTQEILEILPSFKICMSLEDGVLVAESGNPKIIILSR